MTYEAFAEVLKNQPLLTRQGFQSTRFPSFTEERSALEGSAPRVLELARWLWRNVDKSLNIENGISTYGLKNMLQRAGIGHFYSGEFIAAAMMAGFRYVKDTHNPREAALNMCLKDVTLLANGKVRPFT